MNTPICDFVRAYNESGTLRLHMPGHKGVPLLGMEGLDLTEIAGADSLYEADGIIRESEENASSLFGCPTYYSTEGSSQCIRAMLQLLCLHARKAGKKPVIAAGRNAHKTFLSAAVLLDFETVWLCPEKADSYLSCAVTAAEVERFLAAAAPCPTAVYLTSPDYLGCLADIEGIARVCHRYGVLLAVDNAHGAYLHFLPEPVHPMDLGADLCCDSAHKTLPALTGAAYLHLSETLCCSAEEVKNALALFGSTSPSYLILQSLDRVNRYLAEGYPEKLAEHAALTERYRQQLADAGYTFRGEEPTKLTVCAKPYGYRGYELAGILRDNGIECEFADPDFLVLMTTPETGEAGLRRLTEVLTAVPQRTPIREEAPVFSLPERVMSPREAAFAPRVTLPACQCAGRVLAEVHVGCPPAVPVVVCGERMDPAVLEVFRYYGITQCSVIE